jgi:Na+-driven multidrug efflux pump
VYSVISNAVDASFGISTIIILGHLGKGHLSAGVIALAFYNISWYFLEGMLTAQDNLVARAFALKDRKAARYWSYISFGVTVLICIPTTVLFIFAAIVIQYAFLIRPHTAAKAAEFLILLLPAFWFHAVYRVFQKYLQCQKQMRPPLVCGIIGITFNIGGKTVPPYDHVHSLPCLVTSREHNLRAIIIEVAL